MVLRPNYPHPASGWLPYKAIITDLYRDKDKPLKDVMQILETQYGFKATYITPLLTLALFFLS